MDKQMGGVVNFRALNKAKEPDGHPLPRIDDLLVMFGQKTMFSIMDLKDAFHQVPLDPESRPYTCTSVPHGTVQWCVVVMGLRNVVAMFQKVAEYLLREVRDIAAVYVDDILVGTGWQGTWGKRWNSLIVTSDEC